MVALLGLIAAGGLQLTSKAAAAMPKGKRPRPVSPFGPQLNRWTGQPHEHCREIARRLRQGERRG